MLEHTIGRLAERPQGHNLGQRLRFLHLARQFANLSKCYRNHHSKQNPPLCLHHSAQSNNFEGGSFELRSVLFDW